MRWGQGGPGRWVVHATGPLPLPPAGDDMINILNNPGKEHLDNNA